MSQENSGHREQAVVCREGSPEKSYHGLFIVDKPRGISSFEVVKRLRRSTGIKKIGHTGTLDPLATGVLPICIGEATKLVPYMFSGQRRYDGEFLLGLETDADDITGKVLHTKDATHIHTDHIREVFASLTGVHLQRPPQFSAVKYRGKPSYYWARKGITVPLEERYVRIEGLDLTGRDGQKIYFDLSCSSGTYVRSIVHEVGKRLECGACLTALRRLQCGSLLFEYAVPLDRLETAIKQGCEDSWLWPMSAVLPTIEPVLVEEEDVKKLRKGIPIATNSLSLPDRLATEPGSTVKVMHKDTIIALGEFRKIDEHIVLQPRRILHTT